jgi:hypothetical protein
VEAESEISHECRRIAAGRAQSGLQVQVLTASSEGFLVNATLA